jgi:serine protease Do
VKPAALWILVLTALVGLGAPAEAQRRERLRSLRDDPAVLAAFAELVAAVDACAVVVEVAGARKALGTVVDARGGIVTKASELGLGDRAGADPAGGDREGGDRGGVELAAGGIQVRVAGLLRPARLVGVDESEDLALLRVADADGLRPAVWAEALPQPGAWLCSPDGDGTPAGIGMLAAAPYEHSAERGYLGVQLHQQQTPVRLMTVVDDTAAAAAGLLPEDVIVALDGEPVAAAADFVTAIQGRKPGETVRLAVRRGEEELEFAATLRRNRSGPRSSQEPLWGPLSRVRAGFGLVLQHDTILGPEACGGPLVDLEGRVVGVNVARAGRVETLALPVETVRAAVARIEAARVRDR